MDFGEKIQKIRKQNNLTQEELAEKLYVSRTAISKWESGKGYPSIDLLKQISKVFNISLDKLLSSEELIEFAENDKTNSKEKNYNLFFGLLDLMSIALIFLPLYGKTLNGYVYSVPLITNNDLNNYIKIIYFVLFIVVSFIGVFEIIFSFIDKNKIKLFANISSLILQTLTLIFCILTREPYVGCFILILILIKIVILFKDNFNKKNAVK